MAIKTEMVVDAFFFW